MNETAALPELGKEMYSRAIVLRGRLTVTRWRRFLVECAKAMNMTPAGEAACWGYPLDGKGGKGYTICQPITESFLVVDTWPDHDGAYFFIASCRRFAPIMIRETVIRFGLDYDEISTPMTLRL